jgi:hypothetical protein
MTIQSYIDYCRPSPKKELSKTKSASGSTSFQDFQDSVKDAWDVGDDEEFSELSGKSLIFPFETHNFSCQKDVDQIKHDTRPLPADGKISKRVAHSAALNVINTHRSETREAAKEATISQERKADSLQRLAIQKGDNPLGIEPVVSPTSRHFPGHPQQLVSKKGLQISMAEGEGCQLKLID